MSQFNRLGNRRCLISPMRLIWLTWTGLTILSTVLCVLGCFFPEWLAGTVKHKLVSVAHISMKETSVRSTLGIYRRCMYPMYRNEDPDTVRASSRLTASAQPPSLIRWKYACGHYEFARIPHRAWRIALVLLICAISLLCFWLFFLCLTGFNLLLLTFSVVVRGGQFLMLISGLLVLSCCVAYVFGWHENSEVQQICGPRNSWIHFGHCRIGWAFVTTLIGGLTALFGAVFPSFWTILRKGQLRSLTHPTTDTWANSKHPAESVLLLPPPSSNQSGSPIAFHSWRFNPGSGYGIAMVPAKAQHTHNAMYCGAHSSQLTTTSVLDSGRDSCEPNSSIVSNDVAPAIHRS